MRHRVGGLGCQRHLRQERPHASLREFAESHPHPEVRDSLLDTLGDPDDTHRFMPLMRRLGLSEAWFTWRRREIRLKLRALFSPKGDARAWGWLYLEDGSVRRPGDGPRP